MSKAIKFIVAGLASLLVVVLIGVTYIAFTFNPNDYKPQIISLVKEKKQRTLTIPGEIKLRFFPKLGADLGRLSVSERNSNDEFASVNSAKVSLALIPLLSKQLIVDRIDIDGASVNLQRYRDGSTNVDDLLGKQTDSSGQAVRFDIHGIDVRNSRLSFDDDAAGRNIEINGLNVKTGRVADAVPGKASISGNVRSNNPALDVALNLKAGYLFDLAAKHYAMTGLDGDLKGKAGGFTDLLLRISGDADLRLAEKRFNFESIKLSLGGKQAGQPIEAKLAVPKLAVDDKKVSGEKISGDLRLSVDGRAIVASFSSPSFEGTPQAFKLPGVKLDATIKDKTLDASAKIEGAIAGDIDKLLFSSPRMALTLAGKDGDTAINGSFITPFELNLAQGTLDLASLVADFTLPNPAGGSLKLNATGKLNADLNKQSAMATLQGKLDESSFDAKLNAVRPPSVKRNAASVSKGATKGASRNANPGANPGANPSPAAPMQTRFDIAFDKLDLDRYRSRTSAQSDTKTSPQQKPSAAEKPFDLSALRILHANGNVKVGALKAENIRLTNLQMGVRAENGKLDIAPLNASLYGGTVSGGLSAEAAATPKFSLRQTLTGVNIAPLLKDAIGKEPVEGRGNVTLDITTEGALVSQLKKNLAGNARLELRDGAVKGFNIAQVIRSAKSRIGALRGDAQAQAGTGSAKDKTDFSEMTGSFKIAKGIAHNDDLRAKSPLIRVDGAGDVNIGDDRLDYVVRATVVSTLQGQGGPELQALKGLTIPVRLSGPFDAIGYKVDFGGLATDLARKQLDGRKDEIKNKVEEQIKGGLKGLFGR